MLSLTVNSPKPLSLSTQFLPRHPPLFQPASHKPLSPPHCSKTITSLIIPPSSSYSTSPSGPQQLYQPFRPPPSPLPDKYRSLDTNGRLEILANRLGLWFEYAPLIPSLIQEGFTPSTLEELTGISSVEQNRFVVAAKVRDSLISSQVDPNIISFFDQGGSEILYEIRLLSNSQRAAAAKFVVERGYDAKQAEDVARAVKDFPRRKGDYGWDSFSHRSPGDCLGYTYFRLAKEHETASFPELRKAALEKAMEVVETENALKKVLEELEGKARDGESKVASVVDDAVRVPVVRMKVGEVAEASSVVVFPVCIAEHREVEVEEAPWEYTAGGEFGVVEADKAWKRWVVLPGWEPIVGLRSGAVVVAFADARVLPWRTNRWYKEEAILVVADRGRKEVASDDSFYLVLAGGNGSGEEGLKVERGLALKEMGVKECLGTVVLVVRPPRDDDDLQLNEEDWE